MIFNIGDKVIFNNEFPYNNDIKYDKKKSYTIVKIINNDIFLDIYPERPLYNARFLLDIKQTRKYKLKKIYENKN